ncbi:MAG: type II secretory pathway predicted ATPase ExeA [Desulforhopalus sp.]|jgi:type II secretory pathway predicted ATPase ExeA
MYKSFYKLGRKPFEITPDTSFLWLGENQKEALSSLRYGILDNKGFLLLTGGAGAGKTSLIKALTKSFDSGVLWAVIDDPSLDRIDFYNEIARNFAIDKKFTSKVQFLIQFSHFLHKADDENKKVLLLVDECHLLSQEMLEELRLLSNIEKADTKLINIFFVGQDSFVEMLAQPKNRAVRQRLTLKTEIPPLSAHETGDYIRHRMNVAGAEEKIFSAKACQMVHRHSAGVPLQINKICDAALKLGASKSELIISPSLIESSLHKIDLNVQSNILSLDEDFEAEHVEPVKDYAQFKLGDSPDSKITGFNLENDRSSGWLKLGLAALALVVVSGYFFTSNKSPVVPKETTIQVVKKVEPSPELPKVSTSPAVAVLEKNGDKINQVKVDELKSAILEKAYEGEAASEVTAVASVVDEVAEQMPEPSVDPVATDTNEEVVKSSGDAPQGEKIATVESVPSMIVVADAEKNVVQAIEIAPVQNVAAVAEIVQVEAPELQMAPLEPRKVMLPLLPNSLKLSKAARRSFGSFVEKLKNYPKATILVRGFVSSKSNSPENIKLSEDRALSVYKLLLKNGVDPEQIELQGMGNKEPIASNDTRAGRAKNRRVEIVVISDGLQ